MYEKKLKTQPLQVQQPTLEDLPAFTEGITKAFVNYEICVSSCQVSPQSFKALFLDHLITNLHPSHNYVLKNSETQKILSGIVAADFTLCVPNPETDQPQDQQEMSLTMRKLASICTFFENMYNEKRGYPIQGSTLYYELVYTDRDHIKKGYLAQTLIKSLKEAKEKGYKRVMAILTSKASQKAFHRLGFKDIGEFSYKDYKFDGQNVFKDPQEERCTLGELILDDLIEN